MQYSLQKNVTVIRMTILCAGPVQSPLQRPLVNPPKHPTNCVLFSALLQSSISQPGAILPPLTDICQCLEAFLIVTTGQLGWGEWGQGGCYWHLVGGGWDAANYTSGHNSALQHNVPSPGTSLVVQQLRIHLSRQGMQA